MKIKITAFMATFLLCFSSSGFACKSDAECDLDQICNDAGQCVADGRDWSALKKALIGSSSEGSQKVESLVSSDSQIFSSESPQFLPNGEHPKKNDSNPKSKNLAQSDNDLQTCGMKWHRDEMRPNGLYSFWRPTKPVYVVVNMTRNGRFVGSVGHNIRPPNEELGFLINMNGKDHDGVQSCNVTW